MISPPEYILEQTDRGPLCVIFDPSSSGEYWSFYLDMQDPQWLIKSKIRSSLNDAHNVWLKENGLDNI